MANISHTPVSEHRCNSDRNRVVRINGIPVGNALKEHEAHRIAQFIERHQDEIMRLLSQP